MKREFQSVVSSHLEASSTKNGRRKAQFAMQTIDLTTIDSDVDDDSLCHDGSKNDKNNDEDMELVATAPTKNTVNAYDASPWCHGGVAETMYHPQCHTQQTHQQQQQRSPRWYRRFLQSVPLVASIRRRGNSGGCGRWMTREVRVTIRWGDDDDDNNDEDVVVGAKVALEMEESLQEGAGPPVTMTTIATTMTTTTR